MHDSQVAVRDPPLDQEKREPSYGQELLDRLELGDDPMHIERAHAFKVPPQKGSKTVVEPPGGTIDIDRARDTLVRGVVDNADSDKEIPVTFRFEEEDPDRENDTRDLMMEYAFGDEDDASQSAATLALKLSRSMDERTDECLFVVTAISDPERPGYREVSSWTFPNEEAFTFEVHEGQAKIDTDSDVFSRDSDFRKAATFGGRDTHTGFLQGYVLDLQANRASRDVANYWLNLFLDSMLAISDPQGTKKLIQTVRETFDKTHRDQTREQLMSGLTNLRTQENATTSFVQFAEGYLDLEAKEEFLSNAPDNIPLNSPFTVDTDQLEKRVQYRVYTLDSGIQVTTSMSEENGAVQVIEQNGQRRLRLEDVIKNERIKSRR